MKKQILTVRDVDEVAWKRFRARALEEGVKTGDALTEAMQVWLEQRTNNHSKRPDQGLLLKIKPVVIGTRKKKVRWSEEIDEIVYGEKG